MTDTIPTLASVDEAVDVLGKLATDHDWVSVFWDRGWGDSGQQTEIAIIVGGNGQAPKAHITDDVYARLLADGAIAENSLATYKARRLHDFKAPSEPEKIGPSAAEVAEQVIRGFMTTQPQLPIRAEFFRGLSGTTMPRAVHDVVTTPACGRGWFVRIIPGGADAAISAAGAPDLFLGPDVVGKAIILDYPQADGRVDLEALAGDDFARRLREVVDQQLAAIAAEKAVG